MSRATAGIIIYCRWRITCCNCIQNSITVVHPLCRRRTQRTRVRNQSNVSGRRTERSWCGWHKQLQATESTCCFTDSFESGVAPWSRTQASGVTSTSPTISWTCSIFCRCCGEQSQMNCFISVQLKRFEDIQRSVSSMQCTSLVADIETSAADVELYLVGRGWLSKA